MVGRVDYLWEKDRLHVSWIGDLGLDDLIGLIQTLQDAELDRPDGFDRLHDLRQAGALNADFNSILHMAANRRDFHGAVGALRRAAFVATHDGHCGKVRIYQKMMENSPLDVRIFGTMDAALAWLDSPHATPTDEVEPTAGTEGRPQTRHG